MTYKTFGKAVGELIYQKRKILGLTQIQLAEDALGSGGKARRISELENGLVANPHPQTIDPIISALGILESELEACFKETGAVPDSDLQKAYDDAEILIRNLAEQYEIENEDASFQEIDDFLRLKAEEFRKIKNALEGMKLTEGEISTLRLDAISALKVGEFDRVDTLLKQAEEKQKKEKTIKNIGEVADIRILRGDSRFLEGAFKEAFGHYSSAAMFFEHFDSDRMIQLLNELAGRIYEDQRRAFMPNFWVSSKLLELALTKQKQDGNEISIGDIRFRLSLIYRNASTYLANSKKIELLKMAIVEARAALKIFIALGHSYKIHGTQTSLGNCLSELTFITDEPSHAKSAIDILKKARSTIPNDADSFELLGHVCNSLGAAILRYHGAAENKITNNILDEVIDTYEEAVKAAEKASILDIYGAANINLARLLAEKSKVVDIKEYVATFLRVRSISCFQTAIETYPENQFPDAFASAQLGLAEILFSHALQNKDEALELYFMRAANAYWQASIVFSEEYYPDKWAYIQCRIGSIFGNHAKNVIGESALHDIQKAISHFEEGLRVYLIIDDEVHIKSCSENIALLEKEYLDINNVNNK